MHLLRTRRTSYHVDNDKQARFSLLDDCTYSARASHHCRHGQGPHTVKGLRSSYSLTVSNFNYYQLLADNGNSKHYYILFESRAAIKWLDALIVYLQYLQSLV